METFEITFNCDFLDLTLIIHHLQNVKVCSQKYHLYIDLELQLSSVDCSGREEVHF